MMREAIAAEIMKAAPPVTVLSVAWMQGLTISDYVGLSTIGYIGLQALYLLWKWLRERKVKP